MSVTDARHEHAARPPGPCCPAAQPMGPSGQTWHVGTVECLCCTRWVRMARRVGPNAHLCPACDHVVTWVDHTARHRGATRYLIDPNHGAAL